MISATEDKTSNLPPFSLPYDPVTLQQRIQREILGLGALADYLVELKEKHRTMPSHDEESRTETVEGNLPSSSNGVAEENKAEMIRIRLDDEYWVDMTSEQIDGFLKRKSACKPFSRIHARANCHRSHLGPGALALRSVEERRANLEQLKEWMIRELQDTTSHTLDTCDMAGEPVERNPEPMPLGESVNRMASAELRQQQRQQREITGNNVPVASTSRPISDIVKRHPSPAPTSAASAAAKDAAEKDTSEQLREDQALKLREINNALEKLGTSMGDVLKLPPSDVIGDGNDGSAIGTEVGKDGTVLNEEGLPFLDIREDLPQQSADDTDKPLKQGSSQSDTVTTSVSEPADDYWSEEAVKRRRELRERLFADDDEDEEETEDEDEGAEENAQRAGSAESDNESDDETQEHGSTPSSPPRTQNKAIESNRVPAPSLPVPVPESISQLNAAAKAKGKGKATTRKPGFLARSMVIDHSVVEEKAEEDTIDSEPKKTDTSMESAKVTPVTKKTESPRSETAEKAPRPASVETPVQLERRKSVTFNPQTRVRLYEKGEVMPVSSAGGAAPPTPAQMDVDSGSRFEVLDDDARGEQAVSTSAVMSTPEVMKPGVKSKVEGTFSGFKKGFLDSKPAVKQAPKTAPVNSVKHTGAQVSERKPPTAPIQQAPTTIESPEYQQPLAPAHNSPAKPARKQKSLFSQRKAESMEARSQLLNFRSFDPMPVGAGVGVGVGAGGPVGTGKEENAAPAVERPIKMAVVERVVGKPRAPTVPPLVSPIPSAPSPQSFPPKMTGKKARDVASDGEDGQTSQLRSGSQTAVKDTIVERNPAMLPQSSQAGKSPRIKPSRLDLTTYYPNFSSENAGPAPADESSDSLSDFEYSDGEDAFDMDEALLAREAALAYHAKRSELGRKGLGGWTGGIGADGEVEWDTESVPMSAGMDEAPPRVGPVAFGERIIPRGMEGGIRLPVTNDVGADSSDEDEMEDAAAAADRSIPASISLPLVVPASENLASSIKIGKLENGNLVVQDTDDSDDSDVEEEEGGGGESIDPDPTKMMTDEQRSARAQAVEERRARRAMIDRLRSGDIAEMIREERAREEMMRLSGVGGYVEPPRGEPPALGGAASEVAGPSRDISNTGMAPVNAVKSVVEKQQRDTVQKDMIPLAFGKAEAKGEDEEEALQQPKRMSKFKAARLARG
ncbi:hypothetical protein QFC22_004602 [Naganishia vaughanmartiniae]|uniref:Uncharacterized protein n=1 Tax=Naganishia vaughanmartiniae TaxID=1424756 RepID=A0ACC2X0K2_9TREE|nr:hypothetical protein QFC22_004602 [Naganishia vaughanmartiniae]